MALGAYAAIHLLNTLLGESSVLREGIGVIGAAVVGLRHLPGHHGAVESAGNPHDVAHLPAARCLRVGETV